MAEPLILTGAGLKIAQLAHAARNGQEVQLDPAGLARMAESHALVTQAIDSKTPVYGVTTGLGAKSTETLDRDTLSAFSVQTLRGRAHATGAELAPDTIRAALIIRLNTFLTGHSAARPEVADHIAACLNAGLTPVAGAIGSVGVADLLPNATIGLALTGEGEMRDQSGTKGPAADMMVAHGITPLTLAPRDGLALASHSSLAAAQAALAFAQAEAGFTAAQTAAALSLEGFRANLGPMAAEVLAVKPHPGQAKAAAGLHALLKGSTLYAPGAARRLQDPLSLRNVVHIHGPLQSALDWARDAITIELNGSSDNPVALLDQGALVSNGAYFTGELTLVTETLSRAIVPVATAQVARIAKLLTPAFSDLPAFLAQPNSASNGLAPLTKTAEALLADIMHSAQPVPTWPSVSAAGVEDALTNAPLAARNLHQTADSFLRLAALEMLIACQAVDLRDSVADLGQGTRAAYDVLRAISPQLTEDRPLGHEIEALIAALVNPA